MDHILKTLLRPLMKQNNLQLEEIIKSNDVQYMPANLNFDIIPCHHLMPKATVDVKELNMIESSSKNDKE